MKAKRKLLGVLAALVLSAGVSVSVYAWAKITTSCGKEVVTVERNAFESKREWKEYMADINEAYCGTRNGIIEYEKIK